MAIVFLQATCSRQHKCENTNFVGLGTHSLLDAVREPHCGFDLSLCFFTLSLPFLHLSAPCTFLSLVVRQAQQSQPLHGMRTITITAVGIVYPISA